MERLYQTRDDSAHPQSPQQSGFGTCRFQPETAKSHFRAAEELMGRHQFQAAYQRYQQALRIDTSDAACHLGFAFCNWHLNNDTATGDHLHEAIRLDPNLAQAHAALAMWYLIHGLSDAAERASASAYALAPRDMEVLTARGNTLDQAGDSDGACRILEKARGVANPTPAFALLNAKMAKRRKNVPDALSLVMAVLSTGRCSPLDASALHLTAAGLLEALGEYDRAFEHAAQGNLIRRVEWNPDHSKNELDKTIAYFTKDRVASLARSTQTTPLPVFVVGFVRSGTSLVEQILASHPKIFGAGEMDLLHCTEDGLLKMLKAGRSSFPDCLAQASSWQLDGIAESHLGPLHSISPTSERIIDKMPFNGLHLGILQMVLPGARVIHCRRDALDTCLSTYMTTFSHGNAFKYDQTHLGSFYRGYERVMEHWKSVLDIPILDVSYEKLVEDIEGESRRMLQFLDMPWNDRCATFYQTKRSVMTASSEQVRNKPYRTSIGRWKHYEKHLRPLKAALGL